MSKVSAEGESPLNVFGDRLNKPIATRLREFAGGYDACPVGHAMRIQAADYIDALTASRAALAAILVRLVNAPHGILKAQEDRSYIGFDGVNSALNILDDARAALAEHGGRNDSI